MSSIVPPLVSGMKNTAQTSCTAIIAAKNANAHVPARSATAGNAHDMSVHMNQCVKQPRACPFALTTFGNTSDMYTQITAPEETAKNAMNPSMPATASVAFGTGIESCHATSACIAIIIDAPPIIMARRPNRSITGNASRVNVRFTTPTPIVPASAASSLPSPKIIWNIRGA